jgi:hypothetical protein
MRKLSQEVSLVQGIFNNNEEQGQRNASTLQSMVEAKG